MAPADRFWHHVRFSKEFFISWAIFLHLGIASYLWLEGTQGTNAFTPSFVLECLTFQAFLFALGVKHWRSQMPRVIRHLLQLTAALLIPLSASVLGLLKLSSAANLRPIAFTLYYAVFLLMFLLSWLIAIEVLPKMKIVSLLTPVALAAWLAFLEFGIIDHCHVPKTCLDGDILTGCSIEQPWSCPEHHLFHFLGKTTSMLAEKIHCK